MGMKNWPHPPGTCRALIWGMGPQIIVCHPCRRYTAMPSLKVPFDPSPFRCKHCEARGEIKDAAGAPVSYAHESWTDRQFLAPKMREKPTR